MKTFSQFLEETEKAIVKYEPPILKPKHWSEHKDADYVLGGIADFMGNTPNITGEELHAKIEESPYHQNRSLFNAMKNVAGGKWTSRHTEEALDLIRKRQI